MKNFELIPLGLSLVNILWLSLFYFNLWHIMMIENAMQNNFVINRYGNDQELWLNKSRDKQSIKQTSISLPALM